MGTCQVLAFCAVWGRFRGRWARGRLESVLYGICSEKASVWVGFLLGPTAGFQADWRGWRR